MFARATPYRWTPGKRWISSKWNYASHKSALEDLQAIQEYYKEQDVPHIGDDFVAAILEHCEMLQIHPDAGRVVPEFNMDHIRELIHAPFRVVYLRQAKEVVLIRVWRSEKQLELPANET